MEIHPLVFAVAFGLLMFVVVIGTAIIMDAIFERPIRESRKRGYGGEVHEFY